MKSQILFSVLSAILLFHQPMLQAQWQLRGINGQNVHALYCNGSFTYAGTQASGFYISTNDGVSWTPQNNGLTNSFVKAFEVSGSNLFAGTNGPAGVYMSTNNGSNWAIVSSGLTNTSVHALALNGTTLVAGTNGGGVFISTNNGATWQISSNGLTSPSVQALLVAGGRMFAGTGTSALDGGVFVSTNNGASWSLPVTSPPNIRSLATNGTDIFAASNGAGVYKSTDNGNTWTAVNSGLTNPLVRVIIAKSGALFAGTIGSGIYRSTNGGALWSQINTGLDSLSILSLSANSTTLYAGAQNGGVWTRPLSQVVAVDEKEPSAPIAFRLEQNYPNPFNPSTIISYVIPLQSVVTMTVFDILGRSVATLVSEMKMPGHYSVEWNASGHSSGLYFYRIEAGRFVEHRKMLLVK